MPRTIVLPVQGKFDGSKMEQEAIASFQRIQKAGQNAFKPTQTQHKLSSQLGFDIEEIKKQFAQIDNLSRNQTRFFAMQYRSQLRESQIAAVGEIKAASDARKAIENEKRREYAEFVRIEKEKRKTVEQNNFSKDFLSSTAFGSFIGSSAGTIVGSGVTKAISLVANLGSEIIALGKSAVQMGADFEQTRNSIAIFAGGTNGAARELAALSETVQNTRGLALPDAEAGYRNLRALGFQAEESRKLVQGLARQAALSGTDSQNVQRVIVNLTQLSAGSARASQDIKEIVHAMPSMRKELKAAFGTLDYKQIGKLFSDDPANAIAKLTTQLEKAKVSQGGLNSEWVTFQNELTITGRDFSREIVPELTGGLRESVRLLRENKKAAAELGHAVADGIGNAVSAVTDFYRDIKAIADILDRISKYQTPDSEQRDRNLDFAVPLRYVPKGDLDTEENRAKKLAKAIQENNQNLADSFNELAEKRLIAEETEADFIEKTRQQALEFTGQYFEKESAISRNYYAIEEAKLKSHLDLTLEEQLGTMQKVAANRQSQLEKEKSIQAQIFASEISLAQGNQAEMLKLELKYNKIFSDLDRESAVAQIEAQAQIARKEREILVQRRQDYLEFKNLQEREISASFDNQIYDIERAIEHGTAIYSDGYNELIEISRTRLNVLSQITKDQYATRLQDESLNAQQIINLTKERDLTLQDLAEESRRRILEIEDQKRAKFVETLNFQREVVQSNLQYLAQITSSFGDNFFNPQDFSAITLRNFQESVLKRGKQNQLGSDIGFADQQALLARKRLDDFRATLNPNDLVNPDVEKKFTDAVQKAETESSKLRNELQAIKDTIPAVYFEFERLAEQIGSGDVDAFDRLNKKLLESRQRLDLADAQSEVDYYQALIEGEKDVSKLREYNFGLAKAQRNLERIQYDQSAESAKLYADSIQGLKEQIKGLQEGDPKKLGAIADIFNKDKLKEAKSLYEEIYYLQLEIQAAGQNDNLKIQAAYLRDILDLRSRELDAIISINRSQLELNEAMKISGTQIQARFLEHLAQQKTLNESIADGIIGTYEAVADQAGKALDQLNEKTKGFLSFIIEPAKAIQRNFIGGIFKNIVSGIFGADIGAKLTKTNNPVAAPIVDKLDETNDILRRIAANKGIAGVGGAGLGGIGGGSGNILDRILGGGGIFTTPPFNSNASGGSVSVPFLGSIGGNPNAGGGGSIWGNLKNLFSTNEGGIFARRGGSRAAGIAGGIGDIAGVVGGLIGGRAGNIISLAGQGASLGAAFGPWGAVIGAAAGGLLGLFMGDPKRKIDKKENMPKLQQGFKDAFKEFSDLIADVNALRVDPDSAMGRGRELRAAIASGFGIEFQSKKYRKQSQALIKQQLAAIDKAPDGLMEQLKHAVEVAKAAGERQRRILPEFADGGSVSRFFRDNFSGLVPGMYDRRDDKLIKVSGNEVVLTPNQWMPITPYLKSARVPGFADGGSVGGMVVKQGDLNVSVELHNVDVRPDSRMILTSDQGKKMVVDIYKEAKKNKEI